MKSNLNESKWTDRGQGAPFKQQILSIVHKIRDPDGKRPSANVPFRMRLCLTCKRVTVRPSATCLN